MNIDGRGNAIGRTALTTNIISYLQKIPTVSLKDISNPAVLGY